MTATELRTTADAVLSVATIGPLLPVRARGKDPLTANGVHGATRDATTILRWLRRWPDCNWGIATGAPGPDVVDIDDLAAAGRLVAGLRALGLPEVATARGAHFYGHGTTGATVAIPGGEVRRRGSYVVCPPSVHPSGRLYTWTNPPTVPLPMLPQTIAAVMEPSAGSGDYRAPVGRVPHGQRHTYLKDLAVRFVRAGLLDERIVLEHLVLEYEHRCEPHPLPAPGSLEALARWAVHTRIAERERRYGR